MEILKIIEPYLNIVTAFIFIIYLIIYIFILSLHIRQPIYKKGYFSIVYAQSFCEFLLVIFVITFCIFFTIFGKEIKEKLNIYHPILLILSLLFNFFFTLSIFFNTKTILMLTSTKNNNEYIEKGGLTATTGRSNSITFHRESYKKFHFFGIILAGIHSAVFGYFLYKFNWIKDKNIELEKQYHILYYFIHSDNIYCTLILLPLILYLLYSIYYLCLSWNKENMDNKIKIKGYSKYCFVTSFFECFFIANRFIIKYLREKKNIFLILEYTSSLFLLIIIGYSVHYRLNCYYIEEILSSNGRKNCCGRTASFFNYLFCIKSPINKNFVDFDSTYIYQSLANKADFIRGNTTASYVSDNEHIDSNIECGDESFNESNNENSISYASDKLI